MTFGRKDSGGKLIITVKENVIGSDVTAGGTSWGSLCTSAQCREVVMFVMVWHSEELVLAICEEICEEIFKVEGDGTVRSWVAGGEGVCR